MNKVIVSSMPQLVRALPKFPAKSMFASMSNQTVQLRQDKLDVFLRELVVRNYKSEESEHRVYGKHCSYRYSVLVDLIPLSMSSIESHLSNKPKQVFY